MSIYKIFISYSRKDMAFAERLEAALKARGFAVFIDRSDIYAFEEWWTRIEVLIASADTVVFVLSPDSVASEVALKEVAFAATLNKRFAPIVCRRVDGAALPEALARCNFIFFDDTMRFDESADRLAEALSTDIDWIRRHTEFGEQARQWALADRPTGLLLRSVVLEGALDWIAARPENAPAPTEETQAFIRESRRAAERLVWLQWMLATPLGAIVCGLTGMFFDIPSTTAELNVVGEVAQAVFKTAKTVVMIVGWAAGGALLGCAQWVVLRRQFKLRRTATQSWGLTARCNQAKWLTLPQARWWVLASSVGVATVAVVAHATVDILREIVAFVVVGAAGGALLGFAQWLVLRQQFNQSGWWILASAMGGIVVAGGIMSLIQGTFDGILYFLVGVAAFGAITGRALIWLLRRPATTRGRD